MGWLPGRRPFAGRLLAGVERSPSPGGAGKGGQRALINDELDPRAGTERIRVLYVDDSRFDRALVRDALEVESGRFTLVEAATLEELETILQEAMAAGRGEVDPDGSGPFDLVLSDFNILGMTGLDVLARVRRDLPQVPLIIVTGTGSEEIAVEAMKSGADDYVIKQPSHIRRLPETIRSVLRARQARVERDRARTLLEESEFRFRLLAEHATDLILRLDARGEILYASPSARAVVGVSPDALVGRRFDELVDGAGQERVAGILERGPGSVELPPVRIGAPGELADGGEDTGRWVQIRGRVVEGGNTLSGGRELQLACRDVTAQRRMEDRLEVSRERIRQLRHLESVGRLAGGIAHDFNNLLTVISGNVELLHAGLEVGHPLMEEVEEIRRAARRAGELTRHLLSFSSGEVTPVEAVDVAALVEETEGLLRRALGADVTLEVEVSEPLPHIESSPARLQQVLVNLALNARDAVLAREEVEQGGGKGEPGRVRLTVDSWVPPQERSTDAVSGEGADGPPGDASNPSEVLAADLVIGSWLPGAGRSPLLRIRVTDNGCGMGPGVMERVFEPFFTTKEVGKGTGLGLASSFGTVRQAGGTILVDSKPGQGSTFTVLLPVEPPAASQAG
ncbi:MAG: response regulator [Gemmatimonadales bacterium]|nr:MAG: response regulator [Gemmatimonadales bacterium]